MNLLIKGCLVAGVSLIAIGSAITAFDGTRAPRSSQGSAIPAERADVPQAQASVAPATEEKEEEVSFLTAASMPEQFEGLSGLRVQLSGGNLMLTTGNEPGLWVGEKLQPYIQCERKGDTLVLTDTLDEKWWKNIHDWDDGYYLSLVLPEQEYARAEVSLGIGDGVIDRLTADTIEIHAGAGEMTLSSLSARRMTLNGGAGDFNAQGIYTSESAEIYCGVGQCCFIGDLRGQVTVSGGIGQVDLLLAGDEEDYSVSAKAGLGTAMIGDRIVSTFSGGLEEKRKDAENSLDISCGVGEVTVSFSEDII